LLTSLKGERRWRPESGTARRAFNGFGLFFFSNFRDRGGGGEYAEKTKQITSFTEESEEVDRESPLTTTHLSSKKGKRKTRPNDKLFLIQLRDAEGGKKGSTALYSLCPGKEG